MTNPDVNLPISKESSTTQTQSEDQLITIKNLNRRSLVGLLDTAALLQSLADYLRRNGKQLISKGLKADNIKSAKNDEIVKKYIYKMPDQGFDIIDRWVKKQTEPVLTSYLKDEKNDEDTLFEYLSGLRMYMLDLTAKPQDFHKRAKTYLACYLDPKCRPLVESLDKVFRKKDNDSNSSNNQTNLAELVADPKIALTDEKFKDSSLHMVLACAVAIKFNEPDVVHSLIEKLKQSNLSILEQLLEKINLHVRDAMPSGTIQAKKISYARDDEFDNVEELEVLTQCERFEPSNKDLGKMACCFSKVLAVKRINSAVWKELSRPEAKKLFPKRGSIMHFSGKNNPQLPPERSYSVWCVKQRVSEDRKSEVENHVHAVAYVMPAQQILSLENIESKQTDQVIAKLKELNQENIPLDENAIIRLKDGIYIQSQEGLTNFLNSSHNEPLWTWSDMNIMQLNNGLNLHIGELPDISKRLYLSEPEYIVRQAIEQLVLLNSDERKKLELALEELQQDKDAVSFINEMQLDDFEWQTKELENLASKLTNLGDIAKEINKIKDELIASSVLKPNESKEVTAEHQAKIKEIRSALQSKRKELSAGEFSIEVDKLIDRYFERIASIGKRIVNKKQNRLNLFNNFDTIVQEQQQRLDAMDHNLQQLLEENN